MSSNIAHYSAYVGARGDKFHKATMFQGVGLLLGLNCLEPGQVQPVHDHADQDKFYYVIEGTGRFTLGGELIEAGPGQVAWAPAGLPHGVENRGKTRLTLLVGIAPPPGER